MIKDDDNDDDNDDHYYQFHNHSNTQQEIEQQQLLQEKEEEEKEIEENRKQKLQLKLELEKQQQQEEQEKEQEKEKEKEQEILKQQLQLQLQLKKKSQEKHGKFYFKDSIVWADAIYDSKAHDIYVNATIERKLRFRDVFSKACKNINTLDLTEATLGENSAIVLANLLLTCSNSFTNLSLCGNQIKDNGAIAIARVIEKTLILKHLDLRSNNIGSIGASAIFNALSNNKTIEFLDFSSLVGINRNHIGVKGAEALSLALLNNKTIQILYLNGCGVGSEGIEILSKSFATTSLIELNLGISNIGPEGANLLADALFQNGTLKKLQLERNDIGNSGSIAIARHIYGNSQQLTLLDLSNNQIGPEGGNAIGNALRRPNNLSYLNLSNNNLKSTGINALCSALRQAESMLQTLLLCNVGLNSVASNSIAESLRNNISLLHLDLSENDIFDEGSMKFGDLFTDNNTLRTVELRSCKIGDEGGICMFNGLRNNQSISSLNLRYNNMKEKAGYVISEVVQHNITLLNIDVNFNELPYATQNVIIEIIQRNQTRWKASSIHRHRAHATYLEQYEIEMKNVNGDLAQTQAENEALTRQLANDVENEKLHQDRVQREMSGLEQKLQDIINKRRDLDNETKELNAKLMRDKSDKDLKYRTKISQLQKETEAIFRFQKKKKQIQKDVEELQIYHNEKVRDLNKLLSSLLEQQDSVKTVATYHQRNLQLLREKLDPTGIMAAAAAANAAMISMTSSSSSSSYRNTIILDDQLQDYMPIQGLDKAIGQCISNVSKIDIRKKLWSQIILTGGGCMFNGLSDFLRRRLIERIAPLTDYTELNVYTNPKDAAKDLRDLAWKGGAIAAQLDASWDAWISRKDYENNGIRLVKEKSIFEFDEEAL